MPNKMERFSQAARRVVSAAQEAAVSMNSASIDTEHLLLGLLSEAGSAAAEILGELGIDYSQVAALARAESEANPTPSDPPLIDLSANTKKTLELAVDEARRMGHHYIGSEHLLLGLARMPAATALDILRALKVTPDQIRQQYASFMQARPSPSTPLDPPLPARDSALRQVDYFLLRTVSRTSGGISQLPIELSAEVKDALEDALKEVGYSGSLLLEERHLLLGLLHNRQGALRPFLQEAGVDPTELIQWLRHAGDS